LCDVTVVSDATPIVLFAADVITTATSRTLVCGIGNGTVAEYWKQTKHGMRCRKSITMKMSAAKKYKHTQTTCRKIMNFRQDRAIKTQNIKCPKITIIW